MRILATLTLKEIGLKVLEQGEEGAALKRKMNNELRNGERGDEQPHVQLDCHLDK